MSSLAPTALPNIMPQSGDQQPSPHIPGFRTYVNGLKINTPQGEAFIDCLKLIYDEIRDLILNGISADSERKRLDQGIFEMINLGSKLNAIDNTEHLQKIISSIVPFTNQIGNLMESKVVSARGLYDELSQSTTDKNEETDPDVNKHLLSLVDNVARLDRFQACVNDKVGEIAEQMNSQSIDSDIYFSMVEKFYSYSIYFGLEIYKFDDSHTNCLKAIEERAQQKQSDSTRISIL
ncbi:hypothetical protein H4219_004726 [Mycoemilia scoparia]|uniref:Uncharacterized protein n=1 Tax=Mycoemilia scoparia TaxID=417184 RepID=A0A9W8DQN4_9FUNG|nr:hypothetical protein H4219_004726 [Mycoemilia scoparia]